MPDPKRRAPKRRPITAEDLYRLRVPLSVALEPDGKKICYAVEWMDEKEQKYFASLFLYDLPSRREQQFTFGNHHDHNPVWSPDGGHIAFQSVRDKKTGIYLMASGGGGERKVIEIEGSIDRLQWTPDGRGLVFALRYSDAHFIKDEKEKTKPPVYRHTTRLWFRLDGLGYLPKDTFQVYHLDIDSGRLRRITKGKRDNVDPCVSPDGRWIAYTSNRSRNPDLDQLRIDLFVVPFRGGKERKVATPPGPVALPAFSPNGKTIAYIGHDNPDDEWGVTNLHIWKVGLAGRPVARDLMPRWDRMVYDQSITDSSDSHALSPITWSADGKRIFFLSSDTGTTTLCSVPAAGGTPTRLFEGKCHIKGYSVNGRSKVAAVIHADTANPGDVMTCPTASGAQRRATRHTDLNRFLRTEVRLGRTRNVMFKSFDGTFVQGWMVLPPNFKAGRRYPAILEIHGGPRVQYAHTFFHEMQYLAAKGYVVFYTNPRGGSSRGETWAAAISGGWGDLDYRDCMAAADYLERKDFVDGKRMGVTGGSYGGYMTNWIVGHTDRFRAAVTQRSVVDLRSFVGSSDIGFDLNREFKGWPWSNAENYEKCSPISYFRKVRTPVLIIHSEQDLRCNIEQADQMFVMLKALGKKVEMVRFPEESHGLSRHGRPDRRIARLGWIVKWFDRYLKR